MPTGQRVPEGQYAVKLEVNRLLGWSVRLIWGLSKKRPYPVQQSISFRRVKSKQMNAVEIENDHRGDCCVKDGATDHDDSPFVPDRILLGAKDHLKGSHEDVSANGKQWISHFVIPFSIIERYAYGAGFGSSSLGCDLYAFLFHVAFLSLASYFFFISRRSASAERCSCAIASLCNASSLVPGA
jgi:hypothetical protein